MRKGEREREGWGMGGSDGGSERGEGGKDEGGMRA